MQFIIISNNGGGAVKIAELGIFSIHVQRNSTEVEK